MEDRTRWEALLESIQRDVKVIAEGHGALAERLDRFETRLDRLENRFEQVVIQVEVLETKVNALETRVNVLEANGNTLDVRLNALSVGTQHRLGRIERYLGLKGPPRSGKHPRRGSSTRRKAS